MGFVAGAVMLIFTSGGYVAHTMPPSVSYFTTLEECEFARSLVDLRTVPSAMKGKVTVVCLATGARP